MVKVRKLTAKDVTFSIEIEAEDTPVRGNFMASGDDAADKADEDAVIAKIESGDTWAWCTVFVWAKWKGHRAQANLGCCSYEGEADFKAGGYYEDMCAEALDALNADLQALANELPIESV
jgi:hypothetical protein